MLPPTGHTEYRLLKRGVSTFEGDGSTVSARDPPALNVCSAEAMRDIAHFCGPRICSSCAPSSTDPGVGNDRFVSLDL